MKLRNKKTGKFATFVKLEKGYIILLLLTIIDANDVQLTLHYFSLAEVIAEWEDYKTPMPKIKGGKICKIVRDWYNQNDNTLPIYCEDACTLSIYHGARIEFQESVFRNLEQDYGYSITELCGEEE